MTPGRKSIAGIFSTLLVFSSSSVGALEVYKWVGADGLTHYAEAPPESGLASLEILNVSIAKPASPAVANYQSTLEVASSIETSRLERERAQLERQKLLLQERQLKQSQQAAQQRNYARETGTNIYHLPYHRYRLPHPPHFPRDKHYPDPAPNNDGNNTGGRGTTARAYLNR